jgi:hypothetical protein
MSLPRYRDPITSLPVEDDVLRNKLRSNNWDGAGSLPTVDATATEGYLLDPATGVAQFTDLYVGGRGAPRGLMAYGDKTATQTGIGGSLTDVTGLTATFTAITNRLYRLTAWARTQQSTASDVWIQIADSGNSPVNTGVKTGSSSSWDNVFVVIGLVSPPSGSITYKVRALVGAGTVSIQASSASRSYLIAEDIGAFEAPS